MWSLIERCKNSLILAQHLRPCSLTSTLVDETSCRSHPMSQHQPQTAVVRVHEVSAKAMIELGNKLPAPSTISAACCATGWMARDKKPSIRPIPMEGSAFYVAHFSCVVCGKSNGKHLIFLRRWGLPPAHDVLGCALSHLDGRPAWSKL
jgi:hypothetical protein